MTDEKIIEVTMKLNGFINMYERYFSNRIPACSSNHLIGMCRSIREFVIAGKREKAMRWLGYIQGVMVCQGVLTLKQAKELNKP